MRAFSLDPIPDARQTEEQSVSEVVRRLDTSLSGMKKALGINPVRVSRELHGEWRPSLYLVMRAIATLREHGFDVEADSITRKIDPYLSRLERRH